MTCNDDYCNCKGGKQIVVTAGKVKYCGLHMICVGVMKNQWRLYGRMNFSHAFPTSAFKVGAHRSRRFRLNTDTVYSVYGIVNGSTIIQLQIKYVSGQRTRARAGHCDGHDWEILGGVDHTTEPHH
ncbi:hypothetical protein PENTCL1PPCAC_8496 [Pristionchus entomophagus]|uniref:Uncharacterized protein n=1 Tax=Pristionchus entomophagus TaxID=358040 RepID=A0AAV5SSG3_9BILA|nr:hypothetical protein PENTCL1PPCAC_8496 [Pristionchus entomophagus]